VRPDPFLQAGVDEAGRGPLAGPVVVAAVILPVTLGMVWIVSPALVFIIGAGFAVLSLLLSQLIPPAPERGTETVFSHA